MELMARYPDNHFELAIVDPPYGIGISKNPVRQQHAKKEWDNAIPTEEYFYQLFRVSKEQIIWGGNYFDLPPTQGFFIWDKKQPHDFSLSMCEYAWSSKNKPAKMWTLSVLKEKVCASKETLPVGITSNRYPNFRFHHGSRSVILTKTVSRIRVLERTFLT